MSGVEVSNVVVGNRDHDVDDRQTLQAPPEERRAAGLGGTGHGNTSSVDADTNPLGPSELRITARGSCEEADGRHLRRVVAEALESGCDSILLDLSDTDYFSEHCLAALLGISKQAREHEAHVRLVRMSAAVERKIKLSGLDEFFDTDDQRANA